MRRLKILTWHIHGSYLFYLSKVAHDIYLPVNKEKTNGYFGRTPNYDWPDSVHEVDPEEISDIDFDCVVFQSAENYTYDQYQILSAEQRQLPKIYLEHDPPRLHPTDTKHVVDDPEILVVHVTDFNRLMWDCGQSPTYVIEHGVPERDAPIFVGDVPKGVVVVNNMKLRGRRLGVDIYKQINSKVSLDLVGMNAEVVGGLGEIPYRDLPEFMARYRFFFNPIRYTSLGLAVCEAMMAGIPVVGLATTEMVTVIKNNFNGFVDTNLDRLTQYMSDLINDPDKAERLGVQAHKTALERFSHARFVSDWERVLSEVVSKGSLCASQSDEMDINFKEVSREYAHRAN